MYRRIVEREVVRLAEAAGGDPAEVLRAIEPTVAEVTGAAPQEGRFLEVVPATGVSALGRAIREAWLRDPALLAREPTFPPREALAHFEKLVASDPAEAQRFAARFPAVEVAKQAREAQRVEAQRRLDALSAERHSLAQSAGQAADRATFAERQAAEAERRLAAWGRVTPGSIGEQDRSRAAARATELRATATAAKVDADRLAAEVARITEAVGQVTAAA